ncbi:hypothetical protein NQ314_002548 [Rhamnusium bicolor]|uniref:PiggyBac transposable element-derived protein domain-containing protein n=1 Tax=Rhamnusium bicolor TaxID=1586634 RepID=A0AAV8ZRW5_9CUCU|nr:hypothetical protein NQ314_002548 [Rhamnusium bicolor]
MTKNTNETFCARSLGITLHEALEIAYSEDIEEIYVEPPEVSSLTDEDSGDEDIGGTLDNLSGRQLRSAAELVLKDITRISCQEDIARLEKRKLEVDQIREEHTEKRNNENRGKKRLYLRKQRKKQQKKQSGIEKEIQRNQLHVFFQIIQEIIKKFEDLSCTEIFEKFITDDVIDLFVPESKRYAFFKNCNDPKITPDEITCFITILIVSGYDQRPGKRMFWDSANDMRNYAVSEAMRRNREDRLRKCPLPSKKELNKEKEVRSNRP